MNSFNNNDYIDLLEIAKDLWAYKFLMIILAVVIALLSIVRVTFFVPDQYAASGMLYISNRQELEDGKAISQQDINTAKSMSATYREILKTREFLLGISNDLDGKYSWGQIKRMTSINAVNNTEIMEISVIAGNPKDAYEVANAIVKKAPERLSSVFQNGQITIIDNVVIQPSPLDKGMAKQGAMGAFIGVALGAAFVIIKNLFDTKIHKSEDVANRYSVSILGEIAQ